MSRFYLRLTLPVFLLFTLMVIVIRAQPYDDYELRQLMLPHGCPAPCFMGIRPGVTRVDQALKILGENKWVEEAKLNHGVILINWNENAPSWLENRGGKYIGSLIRLAPTARVSEFQIDTSLTLGQVQLIWGRPTFQFASPVSEEGYVYMFYSAIYPKSGLLISVSKGCWDEEKGITYQDTVRLEYTQSTSESAIPFTYDSTWKDAIQMVCN